ncbi:MAG: EF-hand domain-containing protein [Cyclobacteriaceae bacterium]
MPSPLQIEKLTHLFNIIDFDHNGKIEKSDFDGIIDNIDVFTSILHKSSDNISLMADGETIWREIVQYFANSKLLFITLEQWIQFINKHFLEQDDETIERNVQKLVYRIQKVFDKDGDVQISRLEFLSIFVSCRVEVRYANECFKVIDRNQDGQISMDELLSAAKEFFTSSDPEAPGNYLFGKIGSTHLKTSKMKF